MSFGVIDYGAIAGQKTKLTEAQNLVTSIVTSETYKATLTDAGLNSGMQVSLDAAKAVLGKAESDCASFPGYIAHLG